MSILAVDLGGTKLATALITETGQIKTRRTVALDKRSGGLVGELIAAEIKSFLDVDTVHAAGVAIPGIYSVKSGKVWAPNIPGWEQYPLLEELSALLPQIPVVIESDRACYISGETWLGSAKGCTDAVFMAVGTGIGAGIICGGNIIRGAGDIAGAIGWMALENPYNSKYDECGCYEYNASGEGIRKVFVEMMQKNSSSTYSNNDRINAHEVFRLFEENDETAVLVINHCIRYWAMAAANLVSIFNPQKIIFGGGVFGPAGKLLEEIRKEAAKWAQPISMQQVEFTTSSLGDDAGLLGAAYLALNKLSPKNHHDAA